MTSDTFNAAKSNGQTTLASPDLRAAGNAAVPQFTVKSGSKESLGFFVPDANGKPVAQTAADVQTGNTSTGNTASVVIPKGAMGSFMDTLMVDLTSQTEWLTRPSSMVAMAIRSR
jgi:hypothetical protein